MNEENQTAEEQKQFNHAFVPILFGILALFLVYLVYLYSPTHGHYNPANSQETDHTYSQSPSVSKLPPIVDPSAKAGNEYSEKDKESFVADRSDLAAQWAMAHYTFIGIVIGLIGVAFIIWTLIESKKAAYFAERTLAETRESTRRELRAYLHCAEPTISLIESATDTEVILGFVFKNTGQTPAYVVTAAGAIMTMINGKHAGDNYPFSAGNYTQIANGVEMNGSAEVKMVLSKLKNNGVFIKGASLYCIITIQYFDIYSVGKNRKEDKFSEAFVFQSDLPLHNRRMAPTIVNEKDKKTV